MPGKLEGYGNPLRLLTLKVVILNEVFVIGYSEELCSKWQWCTRLIHSSSENQHWLAVLGDLFKAML